jgi:hypothetical protein
MPLYLVWRVSFSGESIHFLNNAPPPKPPATHAHLLAFPSLFIIAVNINLQPIFLSTRPLAIATPPQIITHRLSCKNLPQLSRRGTTACHCCQLLLLLLASGSTAAAAAAGGWDKPGQCCWALKEFDIQV